MQITDVRIHTIYSGSRLKAMASITIDNEFAVHDIRVINGHSGIFVAMPSKKTPDGEFRDVAHPISSETRQKIHDAVLEVFYSKIEMEDEQELKNAIQVPAW